MKRSPRVSPFAASGALLASSLLVLLLFPLVALALTSSFEQIEAGIAHPMFAPAMWLSLRTTAISLVICVVMGTPLAWWLSKSRSSAARIAAVLVELPIVIPPVVVGVALLQTFGRQGVLGPALESAGINLPFTQVAVILAQVVVAAPFYVQAAANAFRKVEPDMLIVARGLGASPRIAFVRVALPIALPGLIAGASLAWARALGEFGATLLFAGNMPGKTQTMPLAIFASFESDVRVAVVFALGLTVMGVLLLVALRLVPAMWRTGLGRVQ